MTSQQRFKDDFLSSFKRSGVDPQHVKELFLRWAAEEQLISLEAWDGAQFRPWHLWEPPEAVFASAAGRNQFRVKLLAAGAEYVELIHQPPVGFRSGN